MPKIDRKNLEALLRTYPGLIVLGTLLLGNLWLGYRQFFARAVWVHLRNNAFRVNDIKSVHLVEPDGRRSIYALEKSKGSPFEVTDLTRKNLASIQIVFQDKKTVTITEDDLSRDSLDNIRDEYEDLTSVLR